MHLFRTRSHCFSVLIVEYKSPWIHSVVRIRLWRQVKSRGEMELLSGLFPSLDSPVVAQVSIRKADGLRDGMFGVFVSWRYHYRTDTVRDFTRD